MYELFRHSVLDLFRTVQVVAMLGLLVSVATVLMGLVYAIAPTERRLMLMRPLSLAAIFGGITTFTYGVTAILMGISASRTESIGWWRVAAGAAEAMTGLVVAFGCLTIAWLLVIVGMRRA